MYLHVSLLDVRTAWLQRTVCYNSVYRWMKVSGEGVGGGGGRWICTSIYARVNPYADCVYSNTLQFNIVN